MSKETITFALDGTVTLELFANALEKLNSLLQSLSKEVVNNASIEWNIEELIAGSASATFRGESKDTIAVERVVEAYESIGEALAYGAEIPFPEHIRRNALDITDIMNGKITSIRFETSDRDFVISSKPKSGEKTAPIKYSLGSVKGKIQTVSSRKRLSFIVWDSLYDRPVRCYLKEGEEELIRKAWGKLAIVSGKIGRQVETGRPIVIREVNSIRTIDEPEPGSYKKAKGIFPWKPGDEEPEILLRRLRDA